MHVDFVKELYLLDTRLHYGINIMHTLSGLQRTNDCSEGKNHPDIYIILNELQKEQADYETLITELSLGRKVEAPQKKKWKTLNARFMSIQSIVSEYKIYKEENRTTEYLKLLAITITLD